MNEKLKTFLREANLIGGTWLQADSGKTIDVINPADGTILGRVPSAGKNETRRAIEAAEKAFASFCKTTANQRADWLRAMRSVMIEHADSLAQLLTLEQGKSLKEAKGEIMIGAAYLQWFAEEGRRVYGDIVPSPWVDRQIMVVKEPVGVVAAITPWNFPSAMLARKIGPAIATGCTSVVKPAIQTPYSAFAWGVIAEMAGLPPGVINIVTGPAQEIGAELTSNPVVRKITFTGSTEVGVKLMQQSAAGVKKVSMELGGNAPFIVFDDADLDRAVEGAMIAKFRNSGQTCVCTNRFFVHRNVIDEFVARLTKEVKKLIIGPGLESPDQGPLIDQRAADKVDSLVKDAKDKGASVVTGGKSHERGGSFYEPTVIRADDTSMRISQEEIFGPVAVVYPFTDEKAVIAEANSTRHGLACYFYTRDLGRAFRVMQALHYGLVGVNEGLITTPEAPFGGVKESGLGSEGGRQGIQEYLNTKYVCVGGLA